MSKQRNEMLNEIDSKNQNLRETEMKLKLTQNDIEIMSTKTKSMETQQLELQDKNEELEARVQGLKDQLYKVQKEKDHSSIQLNNKIEIL